MKANSFFKETRDLTWFITCGNIQLTNEKTQTAPRHDMGFAAPISCSYIGAYCSAVRKDTRWLEGKRPWCCSLRSDFEVVCQVIFQAPQPYPGANPGLTALLCFLKAGSRTLKKYKVNDIWELPASLWIYETIHTPTRNSSFWPERVKMGHCVRKSLGIERHSSETYPGTGS